MVVVSMLPHAEIGRNDHQEGAPYFKKEYICLNNQINKYFSETNEQGVHVSASA